MSGGVNPAGMVKLTGELDARRPSVEAAMDPEPAMMAPLRFPSIDSEFATASRICGCAGMVMVRGTCETGTAGTVAMAANGQPTISVTVPEISARAIRLCFMAKRTASIVIPRGRWPIDRYFVK
ncbi:MAG: hypothetical protein ACYDAE_27510 [Steroidobacteraceae bacterium]